MSRADSIRAPPAVRLTSRVLKAALFLGLLGCSVGIFEGILIGMFLAKSGDADLEWMLLILLDRGVTFGLLGVCLGAVTGVVSWALRSRRKAVP